MSNIWDPYGDFEDIELNSSFYQARMNFGGGSSPGAIPAGAWSEWAVTNQNYYFTVRMRPDMGQDNQRFPVAAEARSMAPTMDDPHSFENQILEANHWNTDLLLNRIIRFRDQAWSALETSIVMGMIPLPQLTVGAYSFRIVMHCTVTRVGWNTSKSIVISSQWASWDMVPFVTQRMLSAPGTIRFSRSGYVPRYETDVVRDQAGIFETAESSFSLIRINWVSLLCFNVEGLLIGAGVVVNQLKQSWYRPSTQLMMRHGIPLQILTPANCLYISLAVGHYIQRVIKERPSSSGYMIYRHLSNQSTISQMGMMLKDSLRVALERLHMTTTHLSIGEAGVSTITLIQNHVESFKKTHITILNTEFEPIWSNSKPHSTMRIVILYDSENQHYVPLFPFEALNKVAHVPRTPAQSDSCYDDAKQFILDIKEEYRKTLKSINMNIRSTPQSKLEIQNGMLELKPSLVRKSKTHTTFAKHIIYMDLETEQRSIRKATHDGPNDEDTISITETADQEQLPLMLGFVCCTTEEPLNEGEWPEDLESNYRCIIGYDCIHEFFRLLDEMPKEYIHGSIVYAHNGGKFDYVLVLRTLLQAPTTDRFMLFDVLPKGSGFLVLTVRRLRDNAIITFKDTIHHLAASLDKLCKDFKPPHMKLTGTVDYDGLNLDLLQTNSDERAKWEEYLQADVLSMAEIFETYRSTICRKYSSDISGTKTFTAATLSKHLFLSQYYDPHQYPIYSLGGECEIFVRKAYHGGRTEVFRHYAENTDIYYYDVCSLYPSEMRKNVPYGKPTERYDITIEEIKDGLFFGFVQVEVESVFPDEQQCEELKFKYPPYLSTTAAPDNGSNSEATKLVFGVFPEPVVLVLFSEEIKHILDNDLPYRFIRTDHLFGYQFNRGPILREFTEELFKRKSTATNSTERRVAKTTVNSGYGFWGMRRARETMGIFKMTTPKQAQTVQRNLETGLFTHMFMCGGAVVTKGLELAKSQTIVPSISAAITAYARTTLHTIMMAVVKNGGNVYYCDTDSVIVDICFETHPELSKLLGTDLGMLTNELEDWCGKKATDFVAIAPKMYALKNTMADEAIYKNRSKGLRNMHFDHMVKMWKHRESYTEQQIQFVFDQRTLYTKTNTEHMDHTTNPDSSDMVASLKRKNVTKEITFENCYQAKKRQIIDFNMGETKPVEVRHKPGFYSLNKFVYTYLLCN